MQLQQIIEINQLTQRDFKTQVDLEVEAVAIYLQRDPAIIYEYDYTKIQKLYAELQNKLRTPLQDSKVIYLDKVPHYPLPFEKLTLGAFIDLETYCSDVQYLAHACTVLWRQKFHNHHLQADQWEPYTDYIDVRLDHIRKLPATQVLPRYYQYLQWRANILERYQGIFNSYQGQDDPDQAGISQAEMQKIIQQEKQAAAFAWEKTILKLVNNDASKFEAALNLPVILAFNILAAQK